MVDTVGKNLANQWRLVVYPHYLAGFHTCQVVQDFFHQQCLTKNTIIFIYKPWKGLGCYNLQLTAHHLSNKILRDTHTPFNHACWFWWRFDILVLCCKCCPICASEVCQKYWIMKNHVFATVKQCLPSVQDQIALGTFQSQRISVQRRPAKPYANQCPCTV